MRTAAGLELLAAQFEDLLQLRVRIGNGAEYRIQNGRNCKSIDLASPRPMARCDDTGDRRDDGEGDSEPEHSNEPRRRAGFFRTARSAPRGREGVSYGNRRWQALPRSGGHSAKANNASRSVFRRAANERTKSDSALPRTATTQE